MNAEDKGGAPRARDAIVGGAPASAPVLPARQVAWLTERASDAIMLTDRGGCIEYVNPAFERLTGWRLDEVIGRSPALLKSGLQSSEVYRYLWQELSAGREFRGVLVNRRRNGELYHEEKSIRPLFDATGQISHLLSCGRDVSDRVAAMARLQHSATHDALTSLPNRALFRERLESALARVQRGGTGIAVVLVDVDAFKLVNDLHGHAAGDALLQAFAERMCQTVRKADTVARLGGDEFALLLEGVSDEREVATLLGVLARALAAPVPHGPDVLRATASLGACVDTCGALGSRVLLERADAAMYQAKRGLAGGWRIVGEDRVTESGPLAGPVPADLDRPPASPLWRSRRGSAGEVLYRQGQRCSTVYVLRRGAVILGPPAGVADASLVRECLEGDWLGLDGVATRHHRRDAVLRTDAELWTIDYDELVAAARLQPELLSLLLDAFAREAAR